jgi:hypothetical protein
MSGSQTLPTDGDEDHTGGELADVTNMTYRTSDVLGSPDADGGRCKHDLMACRRCGSLPPGVNRFYPPPRGVRASLHEQGRWLVVLPNRADRRRAIRGTPRNP